MQLLKLWFNWLILYFDFVILSVGECRLSVFVFCLNTWVCVLVLCYFITCLLFVIYIGVYDLWFDNYLADAGDWVRLLVLLVILLMLLVFLVGGSVLLCGLLVLISCCFFVAVLVLLWVSLLFWLTVNIVWFDDGWFVYCIIYLCY